MKKEKSPVLVILTIFFLSLFVILPPIFRKALPKQEQLEKQTDNKLVILVCSNVFAEESYRVVSKTKYLNNNTISNVITYSKLVNEQNVPTDTNVETSNTQESEKQNTVLNELKYFKSIPNLDIVDSNTNIIITINAKSIDNNPNEEQLKKYFNSITIQQKFYKDLGYKCNIIES